MLFISISSLVSHTSQSRVEFLCVFCCLLVFVSTSGHAQEWRARESEEGKTSQTKLHQSLSRARTALTRGLSVLLLYFFPPIQTTAFILTGPQLQTLDRQQREFTGRTKSRERMPHKSPNDGEMERDFMDTFFTTHILNISEIRSTVSMSYFK